MQNKTNTITFPSALKKQLSFFLAVVMLVTMVAVGILPLKNYVADAAVNAKSDIKTTYSWTISVATTNSADCDDNDGARVRLYGITNNGQGSETQIQEWNYTSYAQGGNTLTANGSSSSFPYKIWVSVDLDSGGWRKWEGTLTLTVNGTQMFSSGMTHDGGNDNLWGHQYRSGERHTDTRPSLAGIYVDGGSTSVSTSGNATSTYSIKGYDNYDVQWSPAISNCSVSSSNGNATCSGTTVTFGNNNQDGANTGLDYSTVISGSGGGLSTGTSGWKTKSVSVKTTHTLNVNVNGGSGGNYSVTGYTGDTKTISTPTKTGYTFSSWTVDGGSMGSTTSYTFENRGKSTITANWTAHTYNIVYDKNAGSETVTDMPSNTTKTYGTNLTISNNTPVRTGYTFDGWDIYVGDTYKAHIAKGGTLSTDYVSAQGATVTLKAKWNAKTWNVIFNGNGSTSGSMSNQQFTSGTAQALTANAFQRKNTITWNAGDGTVSPATSTVTYQFQGWGTSAGSASSSGTTTTIGTKVYDNQQSLNLVRDSDLPLYAVWKTTANSVTAPTPTRNGYDFDKWYSNSNFTGTSVAGGTSTGAVTSSYTMYAKWTQHEYTITYKDSLDSTYSSTQTYYIENAAGATVKAALSKTGYEFAGWKVTTAAGNWTANQIVAPGTSLTNKYGDITLTAQWTGHVYNIDYDANTPSNATASVSGLPADTTKTYGTNYTVPADAPTLTGWTFGGYDVYVGSTYKTHVAAGGTLSTDYVSAAGDTVTLKATWTANGYQVRFNSSLKTSGTMSNEDFVYDTAKTLDPNEFKRSYTVTYNENYDGGTTINTGTSTYHIKGWSNDNHESTRDGAIDYSDKQSVMNLATGEEDDTFADLYIVWKDGGVVLASFNRTGYNLEGWYTDQACTAANRVGAPGDTYYPTSNKMLYANWTEHRYNIVYDANGADSGTVPASHTNIGYFQTVTLAGNTGSLTKTGYTLTGWNTDPDGSPSSHFNLSQAGVSGLTMGTSVTLYAEWTPNNYTVTFYKNDGTTDSSPATATYDAPWPAVPNFSRTGYSIEGWYSAATGGTKYYNADGTPVNDAYTIAGNTNVFAHWQGLTYTVTYNKNTTETVTNMPNPSYVTKTYGTAITLPAAPGRTGYTFLGWDTDSSETASPDYAASASFNADPTGIEQGGNLILFAIWKPVTYTVQYNGNAPADTEGTVSNVPGAQTKTYASNLTLSSTEPSLTGYTFTGWNTAANGSGTPYTKGATMSTDHANTQDAVVPLYAQWTPITYTVSFDGNGATSGTMNAQSFAYDEEKALTSNDYQRKYTVTYNYNYEGSANTSADAVYTFAGWKNGTTPYSNGQTVKNLRDTAGDYPLTAQWTSAAVILPTPERAGYEFGGWFENQGCTGTSYGGNTSYTPTEDKTLYAKWTAVTYTITYKDSHNSEYTSTQNYTIESTDVLAGLTETGYDFAGWNLDTAIVPDNWTSSHYDAGYSLTGMYGNVTLIGQWTAQTYTVAYNANLPKDSKGNTTAGTTTVPGSQTKTYGTDLELDGSTPALTGYSFVGWNTDAAATTAEYAPSGTFTDSHYPGKNGTVTLYAIWAPYTYTVNYAGNGNTGGNTASQTATYDRYFNLTENGFERQHTVTYKYKDGREDTHDSAYATFANWSFGGNTYTDRQEVVNLTSAGNGSVTLTANWTYGSVTLPTPTRVGYIFAGWYAEDACSTKVGNGGASYTLDENTTLYAKWDVITFTVEYYAGAEASGDRPANQSVVYDTLGVNAYADEGSFVKPGYSFTGWNTAADGSGTPVAASYAFTNNNLTDWADADHVIKLYAQWTPNTYVIVYDKGAGASGSTGSQTIRYDLLGNFTVAENGFSYPGYSFTAWKDAHDHTYNAGTAVTSALLLDNSVLNTGDGYYYLTLAAQWERNHSFLEIDHDNGDAIISVDQESSTTYNVSGSFAKTGYTFTGWTLTGENGGTPNGSVNDLSAKAPVYTFGFENRKTDTLTAQWSKNPYTITYHYNVENAPASEKSVTVYYDTEFTFAPEDYFGYRLGYTIDGWATSADGAVVYDCGQVSPATQNLATGEGNDTVVDLYAIWTAKEYEVTFYVNTGFHFADDATAPSQTKSITYGGSQTFTVVLEDGYTQSTGADPAAHVTSGTAAVPDGTKSGNTITFTVTNHGESNVVVETDPLALNTYSVTVIPESGNWNEAAKGYRRPTVQTTVTHGSNVAFSIALLDGYNVASGADLIASATVGGTSVTPAVSGSYSYTIANATGDVMITLADANKNTSTVKFDANGGKWTGDVTLVTDTNSYGATYTVTAPARDGYTFAGWQKVTSGDNASTAAGSLSGNTYTYGTAQGTDYYEAQWTARTYTVVFDGNGGTPNSQSKSVTYGQTWPSPDTTPARTGYDFGGWYAEAACTTPVNLSGTYNLTSGTTVYAKWTKHQYSITLDGTPVGYTVDYPQNAYYGDNYTFTITPETGYNVNAINVSVTGNSGFTTSVSGNVMTVSVTNVTDNNVITVSGAQLTYNVTTNLTNPEAFAAQPATVTVTYNTAGVTVEVTMADGFQNTAPTVEVDTAQTGLGATVTKKSGTDATYVIALSAGITADVTLNVTGAANTYNVTLNNGTGFKAPATQTGTIEYLGYTAFTVELADGYTQTTASDLTYTGLNGTATFEQIDATHIRVIAKSTDPGDVEITLGDLQQDTYTLTFINNGGDTLTVNSPVPATSAPIGYFDTFSFSITLAEGYTEATPVLSCDNNGVTSIVASKSGNTVTYTVKNYFTGNTVLTLAPAAANTSKVTVNLGGGTLIGITDGAEYTGAYKETKSFGKPVKTGYTFDSWVLGGANNGTLTGAASDSAVYTFGPTADAADTLTATYTANTYQVVYYKNDGSEGFTAKDVTYGGSWPTAPTFTRTGYDFLGWYDAAGNGDGTGATAVTFTDPYATAGNTTVYAHWTRHTSTLVVDPNGGKVTVDSTEYNDTTYTATKNYLDTATIGQPTKTGYDFDGWTVTGDNNGTLSGATYTFGPQAGKTDTYTAKWKAKTYTVTYYKNDGSDDSATRTATYNAAWPTAPTFTNPGYTFAGWFTAADNTGSQVTFEGNYTAAANTEVYAHWTINHSYVLFSFEGATMTVGGSTYNGSFSADGDSGANVTIAAPVKTGYTFTGWSRTTAANGTLEGNTYTFGNNAGTSAAPETFVAQWEAKTYTVTFDGNDGMPNSQTATATYGAAYPAPAAQPTRTGYDFAGWFTAASGGTEITVGTTVYNLTAATTLYAHWDIHESTVTVKANGGNWSGSEDDLTYTGAYGSSQAIPVPEKEGYTFNGWALTSEGTVNGSISGNTYTYGVEKNTTDILTAQWQIKTYTVTLTTGTGYTVESGPDSPVNWNGSSSVTIRLGTPYSASAAPSATVNGTPLAATDNGDGTFTYTVTGIKENKAIVIGDAVKNTYTVTAAAAADAAGIAEVSVSGSPVEHGGAAQIKVKLAAGYADSGAPAVTKISGAASISGGVMSEEGGYTWYTYSVSSVTADTIFEIGTATANTYTVRYEKNDGTDAYVTRTVSYGDAWPTAPVFTRTGYTADSGWFTAASGGSAVDMSGAFTGLADVTVYQHWTADTYTITYINNGEQTTADYTIESTGSLMVPTARTGYTFGGWQATTVAAHSSWTQDSIYNGASLNGQYGDVTFTAIWTAKTYTVVYSGNSGTPVSQTATATYNEAYPTVTEPTRVGHTFAGWFTAAEGGSQIVPGTDIYTLTAGTTLYAHWNKVSSSLKVDPNGGSVTVNGTAISAEQTFTDTYGADYQIGTPVRTGYTFNGWTANVENGTFALISGVYHYTFGPEANRTDTLTANWQINTYPVTVITGTGYTIDTTTQTASPVDYGGSYSVTIVLNEGYSGVPNATVNGGTVAVTDHGDGTVTYTVENITEAKTIQIGDATRNYYNVTVTKAADANGIQSFYFPGGTATSVSLEHGNGTSTLTVVLADAYSDSDAPVVTLKSGSASITGGMKITDGSVTGYYYVIYNVTADSAFEISSAFANSYVVSLNDTRVGYTVTQMPDSPVLYQGSTSVQITLRDAYSGSPIPAYSVKIGDTTYSGEGNGHITASQSGNVITYSVTGITANTQIFIGDATINTYGVTFNHSDVGYTVASAPAATVNHGGSVNFSITLAEGYEDSPVPAISATNAASAIGYKDGNTVTYIVTDITDDTVITLGNATQNAYTVIFYPGVGVTIRDYTTHNAYAHGQHLDNVAYGTVVRFTIDDTGATTPTIYANGVAVVPVGGVYSVTVKSNVNITTEDLMYTAIFIDYDRTIIASYVVPCGGNAVYTGATPTRASSEYHDYVFNGWLCVTPAGNWAIGDNMTNLLENRVYQAQYTTYHKNLLITHDETNHWWYCPDCGYTQGTQAHIAGGTEIENVVAATCTTKGSHDEVTYCSVCRYEMSRTTIDDGYNYTNHSTTMTYSVVLYEATCTQIGLKAYYCKACNNVVSYETLPINTSSHTWNAWINNADGTHSRGCAFCNKVETYSHSLREIYRSSATCVSTGSIVSYCPICSVVVSQTIRATGTHIPGDVVHENYVAPTCTAGGSYDSVRYCTTCGVECSRTPVTVASTGRHSYSVSGYKLNNTVVENLTEDDVTCGDVVEITYTCTYENCNDSYTETINVEHDYEWTITAPTQGTAGTKVGVCTRCGDETSETVAFTPLGQRHVQFAEQSGVSFSVVAYKQTSANGPWAYDTNDVTTVRGTITTYTNVDLHFYVTTSSSFAYADYDVYVGGVKLSQNADGTYNLPAGSGNATVNVVGTVPTVINPGDSGSDNGSNVKLSFWQRIINFFKRIFSFFRR